MFLLYNRFANYPKKVRKPTASGEIRVGINEKYSKQKRNGVARGVSLSLTCHEG